MTFWALNLGNNAIYGFSEVVLVGLFAKNKLCRLSSPDGSGIPSRFFYELGYSGQQETIFPDKAYCFAPYFLDFE
jgi:hypothetical protein